MHNKNIFHLINSFIKKFLSEKIHSVNFKMHFFFALDTIFEYDNLFFFHLQMQRLKNISENDILELKKIKKYKSLII